MINKLKHKFTILAAVSILALMTVLVGIMNIINYSVVVKDCDATIDVLFRTNEIFPDKNPDLPPDGDNDTSAQPEDNNETSAQPDGPHGMSPEIPYESRFFIVSVSEDGEILKTDFSKILSVGEETVDYYVKKALDGGKEKGFIDRFRYAKRSGEQETTILFLDCEQKQDAFKTFLWTSVGVGLGGCVITVVIFLLFSGKIVKPIAESYEKQKRFVSDAGHEMKTPLTIINANLDLIEGDDSSSEELNEIRTQTERLSKLTNNLVYLSKMEEAEHKLSKIEMPLSDTVSETVASFRALSAGKDLNFTVKIKPDVSICGSPDAVRQLASILAENAIKYANRGGDVSVELTTNKKAAVLYVRNTTGTQVNKSDIAHVFERFYRTDGSRNSETGGHGIGLSIAKAIVEAHGGTIKAETKTGKDFCVTATLPFK